MSSSWGETLDYQKSSLRWDIKRTIKILCKRLADIGEECFLVSCNVTNGWVSHVGSVHGDDFINENLQIPYSFLDYCRESVDMGERPGAQDSRAQSQEWANLHDDDESDDGPPISIEMMAGESTDEADETDHDKVESAWEPEQKTSTLKSTSTSSHTSPSELQNKKLQKFVPKRQKLSMGTTFSTPRKKKAPVAPITVPGPVFHCSRCNRSFKHKGQYEEHMKSAKHKYNMRRVIACHKCKSKFGGISELLRHGMHCVANRSFCKDEPT